MRRALLLLALILASPAQGQVRAALVPPPPPPPRETLFLAPSLITPLSRETGKCRMDCAQAYYFCLSAGEADDCGSSWGQCRATCGLASNSAP